MSETSEDQSLVTPRASAAYPSPEDPMALRMVLAHYPTGVCAVTSLDQVSAPLAMIVGSFTAVSLDPPLVGFLPAIASASWQALQGTGGFCINVLAADQADLCAQLSSRSANRFAGVNWTPSPSGRPILDGAITWFDCTLESVSAVGDHDFVLGRVSAMAIAHSADPMLFHRGSFGRPVSLN